MAPLSADASKERLVVVVTGEPSPALSTQRIGSPHCLTEG